MTIYRAQNRNTPQQFYADKNKISQETGTQSLGKQEEKEKVKINLSKVSAKMRSLQLCP